MVKVATVGDFDNDGWMDLYVSVMGGPNRLNRNNRNGTFTDVSKDVGIDRLLLTMGANFGDLDNDGWLDFYLGTGAAPLNNVVLNQMFRNAEGRSFQNVTTSGGFGHLQKGHAVAFGDVHGNGQQDVFINIGGAMSGDKFYSALFKNPGHSNHWIQLELVGKKSNRFAIGARLRVRVSGHEGTPREFHRTVDSGGSFGSSGLPPHIVIGSAVTVEEIEIRWPGSGVVQRFQGPIASNARYEIREGEPGLRKVMRKGGAPVPVQ